MQSLILYDSMGGNTEAVARAIDEIASEQLDASHLVKVDKDTELDFLDYDLVFIGSPVIDWLPTPTMMNFVRKSMKAYNTKGMIQPAAPIRPGKFGVPFSTFGGPHIGEKEARPMTLWLASALEHIGYITLDTWHVPGRFSTMEKMNKGGRLGDIASRPNPSDLDDIKNRTAGVIASLAAWRN